MSIGLNSRWNRRQIRDLFALEEEYCIKDKNPLLGRLYTRHKDERFSPRTNAFHCYYPASGKILFDLVLKESKLTAAVTVCHGLDRANSNDSGSDSIFFAS